MKERLKRLLRSLLILVVIISPSSLLGKELTIDPALSLSSYLGGSREDEAFSVGIGPDGSIYVVGQTISTDFPTSVGAHDDGCGTDDECNQDSGEPKSDIFVSRFSADGSTLLASTYIGGSSYDIAYAVAVDTAGNVYVTGLTQSSDFPVTTGAFDETCGTDGSCNGIEDSFVTKLPPDLSELSYSTYIGGSGFETAFAIAVNQQGEGFVGGLTSSVDFPATPLAFDTECNCGSFGVDSFLAKLNSNGSDLVFSSFLGGTGDEQIRGIDTDSTGRATVAGFTTSSDFPLMNPYQDSLRGAEESFVTRFTLDGSALIYSTYLGGRNDDNVYAISVSDSGETFLTGSTWSTNFPVKDAVQTTNRGLRDAFVTILGASGSTLIHSTYLGGSSSDDASGIFTLADGSVILTGFTFSDDFPVLGSLYTFNDSGNLDVFITKLDQNFALSFSTFLGGEGNDFAQALAVDPYNGIVVTGSTGSIDLPTTVDAYDRDCGTDGQCNEGFDGIFFDSFVARVCDQVLGVSDVSLQEGDSGSTDAVFTVSLCPPSSGVSVDYATQDGTATAGSDYTAVSGTLIILAASQSGTITVPILGDTSAEGTEVFKVNLSNPVNTTISDAQAIGTIISDDLYLSDDFEDGLLTWNVLSGTWHEQNGELVSSGGGKIFAPLPWSPSGAFGCSICSIETDIQVTGGIGNRVIFEPWFEDGRNKVQLIMKESSDRWILKQRVDGVVVSSMKAKSVIEPSTTYRLQLVYDGAEFSLYVNDNLLIQMASPNAPFGNIGLKVKNTSAAVGEISVF